MPRPTRRGRGEGSVRLRGGRWYVRIRQGGERREIGTEAQSRQEALTILRTMLNRAPAARAVARVRVRQLVERLRNDYRSRGQNLYDIERAWKHLEPVFGDLHAEDVTTDLMQAYIASRTQSGAASQTVLHEIGKLRRMFKLGYSYTPRLVAEIPLFPTITVHNAREGFFDEADFLRIYAELAEHLKPMMLVAFWIGWRRAELQNMRWTELDLETGELRIPPGGKRDKARRGRVIYLPEPALAELRRWRAETDALEQRLGRTIEHVFHNRGRPIGWYYAGWRAACERAGLPGRLVHDFRRSAARMYRQRGVDENVAMKILGHVTPSIFRRYQIVGPDDLRQAAERVILPPSAPKHDAK